MSDKKDPVFEIRFFERIVERTPNYIEALIPLAEPYPRTGNFQKGLEIDRRLSRLCNKDPVVFYNLACSLALVGEKKEAVKALAMAVKLGYADFRHLMRDKDLVSLHEDPEFQSLLKTGKPKRQSRKE